jgi:hypothetical protein
MLVKLCWMQDNGLPRLQPSGFAAASNLGDVGSLGPLFKNPVPRERAAYCPVHHTWKAAARAL